MGSNRHAAQQTTCVIAAIVLALLALVSGPARAQPYAPITDRDFAVDLYQNVVMGSIRTVSMGGADTSLAEGSSGMPANPASPAVHPKNSYKGWSWDGYADWLSLSLGSDLDNNGLDTDDALGVSQQIAAGFVIRDRRWAFGVNGNYSPQRVTVAGGAVEPQFTVGRVLLAYSWDQLTVGGGVRSGSLTMRYLPDGLLARDVDLFTITGGSFEGGAIWRPATLDLRVGGALSLPVASEDVKNPDCDPMDCQGFILPRQVAVPWRLAVGGSWRFGPTRWNREVTERYRDERYVIVAADIVLHGAVADGYSAEGFVQQVLQPSGRSISASLRTGAEYEWLPGRLRVRVGSYWEPGRIPGIGGRLHGTTGADLRVYSFCLFRRHYRMRVSFTGDVASRYANTGISFGFWH